MLNKEMITRVILMMLFVGLLTSMSTIPITTVQANESSTEAELFAAKGGIGAGILFDDRGNMFIGTNTLLLRIHPDGTAHTVCDLGDLPLGKDYYFMSPMIWDMVMDKDYNIIAAAQDRIVKITPNGEITTLIQENFLGFLGCSGLTIDQKGNLYIVSNNKVIRYTPDLKPTVYIDGRNGIMKNSSFFSINFDPENKNLYISDFNNRALLRYPVAPDGTPGQPVLIGQFENSPLNTIFGDRGNVYVSLDIASTLLRIKPDGSQELLRIKGGNHLIAFGGEGFHKESIYYTTNNGRIFRYHVGEKRRD